MGKPENMLDKIIETTKTNVSLLLPSQINGDSSLKSIYENLAKDPGGE